jgi:hypothetical protein
MLHEVHGISWLAGELCVHMNGINQTHWNSAACVCHCSVWHTQCDTTQCHLPKCGGQHLALTSSQYPTVGVSRLLSTKLNCQQAGSTMLCVAWYKVQFFSLKCPAQLWHPSSLLFEGTKGSLSLHVQWPGHTVDHSPPSSANSYISVTLPLLMTWTHTTTPSSKLNNTPW